MVRELHYDPVFDAQRHFRILLKSMANPGIINTLDDVALDQPEGFPKAAALVGLALLDTEITFWVDSSLSVAPYLQLNTGANICQVSEADFLFLPGLSTDETVADVKTGNFQYPEQGATLIILVETLSATALEGSLCIENKGPGVKNSNLFFIKGINRALLEIVQEKNIEFPLGVDVFFVDQQDRFISFPRSNQFSIKA